MDKLDPATLDRLDDGNHSDGSNLYLVVRNAGKLKSWIFRYTSPSTGKVREAGLGALCAVSIDKARAERDRLRALIEDGKDPLTERARRRDEARAEEQARALELNKRQPFRDIAELEIERLRPGWKGGKESSSHYAWTRSLMVDAEALHKMPIGEITTDDVERVVAPKWRAGHHAEARLLLARLASVFDLAKARKMRLGDNPASWDVFEKLMPARPKEKRHHSALKPAAMPTFMERLRQEPVMAALALEFVILCGVRTSEGCGAEWSEIDWDARTWTVPPSRMKRSIEHQVPLSDRALALLTALHAKTGKGRYVFPGRKARRPLTGSAIKQLCMKLTEAETWTLGKACVHGFRATLRTWCSEQSGDRKVDFAVAESILAHSKQGVVASYDRSEMLERRRPIMQRYADFLDGKVMEPAPAADNVVPLIPLRGRVAA
jgi:integrase